MDHYVLIIFGPQRRKMIIDVSWRGVNQRPSDMKLVFIIFEELFVEGD